MDNLLALLLVANPYEIMVGNFHSYIFYVPTILFMAALICDLFNYFGKQSAFIVGHWLIIFGTIFCIPTIVTGLSAALSHNPNDFFLIKHLHLGYATGISGSFYAGIRISSMYWNLPLLPIHYVWLSLLLVALISWTSDYGALIGSLPVEAQDAITD